MKVEFISDGRRSVRQRICNCYLAVLFLFIKYNNLISYKLFKWMQMPSSGYVAPY